MLTFIVAAILLAFGVYLYLTVHLCRLSTTKDSWLLGNLGILAYLLWIIAIGTWVYFSLRPNLGIIFLVVGTIMATVFFSVPFMLYHLTRPFFSESGMGRNIPEDPTDPFEFARAAEERGEITSAIERYRRVLRLSPDHAQARIRAAILLAEMKQRNAGISLLEEGLALEDLTEHDANCFTRVMKEISDPNQSKVDSLKNDIELQRVIGLEPRTYARSEAILHEGLDSEAPIAFNDTNKAAEVGDESPDKDDDAPIKI